MRVTRFSRKRDLIIVDARLWSPRSDKWVSLVIDTGSVDTMIKSGVIDLLGYSVRDGEHAMSIHSAIGREHKPSDRVRAARGLLSTARSIGEAARGSARSLEAHGRSL
jgi:hypothetical protein